MFAALILEREPMNLADVPLGLLRWVQITGVVAAIGLVVHGVAGYVRRVAGHDSNVKKRSSLAFVGLARALYLAYLAVMLVSALLASMGAVFMVQLVPSSGRGPLRLGDYLFAAVGALALVAVLAPFTPGLPHLRWGRIWALARVSLKEAVRRRVMWAFGVIVLIFLFLDWFIPYKPESQIRNYVGVLYWSMTLLFTLVASLLGAFGIPADVKNQ